MLSNPRKVISLVGLMLAGGSLVAPAAETNELVSLTNTWRYWQAGSLDGAN